MLSLKKPRLQLWTNFASHTCFLIIGLALSQFSQPNVPNSQGRVGSGYSVISCKKSKLFTPHHDLVKPDHHLSLIRVGQDGQAECLFENSSAVLTNYSKQINFKVKNKELKIFTELFERKNLRLGLLSKSSHLPFCRDKGQVIYGL